MCFLAVRGSTQPSAAAGYIGESALRVLIPFEKLHELLAPKGTSRDEMLRQNPLCATAVPVPRMARQRIVATWMSCRTPSLPMDQRSG